MTAFIFEKIIIALAQLINYNLNIFLKDLSIL